MDTPPRKKFLIKLTWRNAGGQNVHHQKVTQLVQAEHPMRALLSDFVVLSSASERPETELFQCRYSLGVFVTEDTQVSSVKTELGKLSVEMTNQSFVNKWKICLQTRYSFLPERRPPWLRKHSFSTAQVHVLIRSPSSALSIPEEEEDVFSALSIAFAWLQKLPSNRVAPP